MTSPTDRCVSARDDRRGRTGRRRLLRRLRTRLTRTSGRRRTGARRGRGRRRLRNRLRNPRRRSAIGQPHVVNRMLDPMQPRTGGKHPTRKNTFDLALQRDFINLDEGVGIRRLSWRARIAHPRRYLQRAELHSLAYRGVEGDDAAGYLVEPGKYRARIFDFLRRHLGDDRVIGLRRRVRGLGRQRIGRLWCRAGRRWRVTGTLGARRHLRRGGHRRPRRRRQGLRLNPGLRRSR